MTSRGSIDQEPIFIDVEVPQLAKSGAYYQGASRWHSSDQVPTPPTSDDEKAKRGRRRAPRLETEALPETGGLPEMMRASSPYAFTKPAINTSTRQTGSTYLSPDATTPPITAHSTRQTSRVPTSVPAQQRDPGLGFLSLIHI